MSPKNKMSPHVAASLAFNRCLMHI